MERSSAREEHMETHRNRKAPNRSVRMAASSAVERLEDRVLFTSADWIETRYEAGGTAVASSVGDFNGDGRIDIGYVTSTGQPMVNLGNGNGSFQVAIISPITYGTPQARILRAADANADGKTDLITTYFL